jgi:beta-lactamase superfamily II metal-dependent hydrolase
MYEVDFVPVGDAGRHGDAITMRFTRPDTGLLAHVVIDAGFAQSGEAVVDHIETWYGTRSIDLAIVTHPDSDHIGGMKTVLEAFDVGTLCIHRLHERGGRGLSGVDETEELIELAERQGTLVTEPFAGRHAFGGALQILGPTEPWYEQLVREQQAATRGVGPLATFRRAMRRARRRVLAYLPDEFPFDDAGGTNPRNNSSAVTLVEIEGTRMLFTADAGVPALDRAWDWLGQHGGDTSPPEFAQLPHHGSRHNGSSRLLDRILGPKGQVETKSGYVNVAPEAEKHPSPRIANAFKRRGYRVGETKGKAINFRSLDAPDRGWAPLVPLPPLDESEED